MHKVKYIKTLRFNFQNDFVNISGTYYRSDMFQYAKQTGGPPLSDKAQNCSINTDADIKENSCLIFVIHPVDKQS